MEIGYVDAFDRNHIIGWAADTDHPDRRLEVCVMLEGQECGRIIADLPREGLRQRGGFGDGSHGFEFTFPTPLFVLRDYEVVVRIEPSRQELRHGRFRIERVTPESQSLRPLLVTATGRSGTTLLMRRLINDPNIIAADAYPYEMKLLTYYARALEVLTAPGDRENSVTPDAIFAAPMQLGLNPFHHRFLEAVFPRREMIYDFFGRHSAGRLQAAFRDIIADFYREMQLHQRKFPAQFFAEKCDLFTPVRNFARLAFDGVKEIVLLRDLRDVHCSRRSFWSHSSEESFNAMRLAQECALQIRREGADDIIFVRYEDLIEKPDNTMAAISRLLGLPQPIPIRSDAEQAVFERHATSQDPAASIGRWKTEMLGEEQARFAQEFRPYLEAFGYEPAAA